MDDYRQDFDDPAQCSKLESGNRTSLLNIWKVMRKQEMQSQSARPRRRPTTEPRPRGTWPTETARRDWEQPPVRRARSRKRASWEATLALLVVVVLIATVATLLIVELWLSERVLPGVYAWDVDLGGLTREEAVARLEAEFRYPADRYPVLRYGDQTWLVDPAIMGARLDASTTVDTALTVGHRGNLLARLQEQLNVTLDGTLVVPSFSFEPNTDPMFLSSIAREVNRPLRNATLSLGENLAVQVKAGQMGRQVDEETTRQALEQRIAAISGGEVELVVREEEPLLADLSAAQAQVERMLSAPVVLIAPGYEPWTIEPATLASWLILQPTAGPNGKATLSVSLDPGQVHGLAEEIAAQVARAPTDAQFRFDDASGTLVPIVNHRKKRKQRGAHRGPAADLGAASACQRGCTQFGHRRIDRRGKDQLCWLHTVAGAEHCGRGRPVRRIAHRPR
jgi:hypothetical protein